MLKAGETAPDFALPDQHGATQSLSNLLAASGDLIVYFYPVDFSPVCTAETCAFRDNYDGLDDLGIQIVGISPQSQSSHKRFAEQFNVPFPLLADPKKEAIKAFGVDGPLGFGVRRVTFHIDASQTIKHRVISDLFVGSHLDLLKKAVAGKAPGGT